MEKINLDPKKECRKPSFGIIRLEINIDQGFKGRFNA
jgi:hypothetical protein